MTDEVPRMPRTQLVAEMTWSGEACGSHLTNSLLCKVYSTPPKVIHRLVGRTNGFQIIQLRCEPFEDSITQLKFVDLGKERRTSVGQVPKNKTFVTNIKV